jgi:hypothetical protein
LSESPVLGRARRDVDLRLYGAWFGFRPNDAGGVDGGVPPGDDGTVRAPEAELNVDDAPDACPRCALYSFCGGATPKT